MARSCMALQPTEIALTHAASRIYPAFIAAGQVPDGERDDWIERSIRDAIRIAKTIDETIQSDAEMD